MAGVNASLSNMGIPGLSGDRGTVYQPIFSNRFRVTFYDFGQINEPAPYDLTRQVRTMDRPKLTFEKQTIYSYVSTLYIVSRAEWQESTIVFYDDITNSVMTRLLGQVSKQQNFFDQTVARAGENYKFEVDLDILAGGGSAGSATTDPNVLQKHSFAGCQVLSYDFGQLTNNDATPMEITMTMSYDNCVSFDQNGNQMGTFSHASQINSQFGALPTNTAAGGTGFNISFGNSGASLGSTSGLSVSAGGFDLSF